MGATGPRGAAVKEWGDNAWVGYGCASNQLRLLRSAASRVDCGERRVVQSSCDCSMERVLCVSVGRGGRMGSVEEIG